MFSFQSAVATRIPPTLDQTPSISLRRSNLELGRYPCTVFGRESFFFPANWSLQLSLFLRCSHSPASKFSWNTLGELLRDLSKHPMPPPLVPYLELPKSPNLVPSPAKVFFSSRREAKETSGSVSRKSVLIIRCLTTESRDVYLVLLHRSLAGIVVFPIFILRSMFVRHC